MMIVNYIRKILKRYYFKFLPILIFLDIFVLYVNGQVEHLQLRHLFLSKDLLGMFANVLYWSILLLPIAVDIIDDMGTFGISIISRVSVFKYATYKLLGITAYCSIFFVSSYLISFVIASISRMPIDLNKNTWLLFFLLLLLSVIVLQLFIMLAWNFKSTFTATCIYIFLIAVFHSPQIQNMVSIAHLLYKANIYAVYGNLLGVELLLFVAWLYLMKKTDFIGIKKGTTI